MRRECRIYYRQDPSWICSTRGRRGMASVNVRGETIRDNEEKLWRNRGREGQSRDSGSTWKSAKRRHCNLNRGHHITSPYHMILFDHLCKLFVYSYVVHLNAGDASQELAKMGLGALDFSNCRKIKFSISLLKCDTQRFISFP